MKSFNRESDRQEVLRRLAGLSPDQPRGWGKMSSHQMICHLSDSFLCPLGDKQASLASVPIPRPIFKFLALYVPMPWPRGVPTRPEMEQGIGGTAPVDFEKDRTTLLRVMERFWTAQQFARHPIFGKMSEKDWMRWGYLHCDHHLRQFGS